MGINYDELKAKAEAAKRPNIAPGIRLRAYREAASPEVTLRLLDIIAVEGRPRGEVCSNAMCHYDECVWSRGVLRDIATLENDG